MAEKEGVLKFGTLHRHINPSCTKWTVVNQAILSNVPSYLEFKPHNAVEVIIMWVVIPPLYNQKASQHKSEMQGKGGFGGLFLGWVESKPGR